MIKYKYFIKIKKKLHFFSFSKSILKDTEKESKKIIKITFFQTLIQI